MQRQSDERSSSRTTVRLLESLLRLSEAHAKLMQRSVVELCDAVVAVRCVSLSQTKSSILESNATLQSDFPVDGDKFYEEEERKVFEMLAMSKERFLESADEDGDRNKQEFQSQLYEPDRNGEYVSQPTSSNNHRSFDQDIVRVSDASSSFTLPLKRRLNGDLSNISDQSIIKQPSNHGNAREFAELDHLYVVNERPKENKISELVDVSCAKIIHPIIHDLIDDQEDW